jgi:hypothetical protein
MGNGRRAAPAAPSVGNTRDCNTVLWSAALIVLGAFARSAWAAGAALGALTLVDFRVLPFVLLAPMRGWRCSVAALPGVLLVAVYNWAITGAPWDFVIWHSQSFPWTPEQFFWANQGAR